MTYELAKQLKDAGFPQTYVDGSLWGNEVAQIRIRYISPVSELDGEDYVKYPTLSELIEAIGIKFISLSLNTTPKNTEEMWVAIGAKLSVAGYMCQKPGSTPEIAVAKLWLELNRK